MPLTYLRIAITQIICWSVFANPVKTQTFTPVTHPITRVSYSAADWGDFDNDGDLDLAICGFALAGQRVSQVYRNDGATLVDIGAGLIGVRSGDICWGDYDNDGDLDLLLGGESEPLDVTRIYRNDSGNFVEIDFGAPDMYDADLQWVDYDVDGDLDVSLLGSSSTLGGSVTTVFRNDGGDQFVEVPIGLPLRYRGSSDWGDFDEDGDPDILLAARMPDFTPSTQVYRNDITAVSLLPINLLGLADGESRWCDFDQDGDLDIFAAGSDSTSVFNQTRIYRNDANVFTDIHAIIDGSGEGGAIDLGDFDGDGDLDVAQIGVFTIGGAAYRFDGDSTFARISLTSPPSCCGTVNFADYDNDSDLDLLMSGSAKTQLYVNSGGLANSPPTAPTGLSSISGIAQVTLSWNAATDSETSASGLSYNVRIGTTPGGYDVVAPMSDATTGYRRIPRAGNADSRLNFKINGLVPGTYYWSVQAIDNGWMGSPFASEQSFTVGPVVFICGDADGSDAVSIADAVFIINYIFAGGPAPNPLAAGDADCSGSISIADAVYLVNYIFAGGPAPCAACP